MTVASFARIVIIIIIEIIRVGKGFNNLVNIKFVILPIDMAIQSKDFKLILQLMQQRVLIIIKRLLI
jgi:hypothetical protein